MPIIYKRKCNNCGKDYQGDGKFFCSIECSYKGKKKSGWEKGVPSWNKGTKGKGIMKPNKTSFKKGDKGEKCVNWKGGITKPNSIARGSIEYVKFRQSVFIRDNYTCQKTGQRGGDLVVHHINNFSEYPELRFDINNGVTLSKKEHKEFHKKYGKKNNTIEQLVEFYGTGTPPTANTTPIGTLFIKYTA